MSLLVESLADTDTRRCHGTQSSRLSPGRSQCLLGFHSDQLEDTDRDKGDANSDTDQEIIHDALETQLKVFETYYWKVVAFTEVPKRDQWTKSCINLALAILFTF